MRAMRIAVLYNAVSDDASADERDVLVQIDAVCGALERLGHEVKRAAVSLNLEELRGWLAHVKSDRVFNLVESLAGSDALMPLVPALLDALAIRYTGAPTQAIFLTNHKLLAKERLREAGLPTPVWVSLPDRAPFEPPYVVKTVGEHASFGLDDRALVTAGRAADVGEQLRAAAERWGRACFAERYVDGREFNVSLLDGRSGPEVLPIAEIDFSAFPAGKPRVVGYRAKWEPESFEYRHTPRRFDLAAEDQALVDQLSRLAKACWTLFGLGGYARVDFRVDEDGCPWILEINANPCLSPDAGFAAALVRAGIGFDQAIQRILEATMEPGGEGIDVAIHASSRSRMARSTH